MEVEKSRFYLDPERCTPSGTCEHWLRTHPKSDYVTSFIYKGKGKIEDIWWSIFQFGKNKYFFNNLTVNQKEFNRKYRNNWNELREYVGYNDINIMQDRLIIRDGCIKYYGINYNVIRMMSDNHFEVTKK